MSACASRARPVAALALLIGAVALGGCGGNSRRDRIEHYIQRANDAQTQAGPALKSADRAYIAFAQHRLAPGAAATRLAEAEATIRSTRAALVRIQPPAEARTLQQRLLHLYDLNAALAAETTALGRYLPGAQHALLPLPGINNRLRRALHASKSPTRQARALATFANGLAGLVAALRDLQPPPLLAPTHAAQITRLVRTRRLALQLRGAIQARDAKRIARVLLRFRTLSAQAASQGTGLQTAALRRYDKRYLALRRAAADVERERNRLEREFR